MLTTRASSAKKYKEYISAEKEKKEWYIKVRLMSNRMKNLQIKQNEVDLKVKTLKTIQNNSENYKKFKEQNQVSVKIIKKETERNNKQKKKEAIIQKNRRVESWKVSRKQMEQFKQRQFSEIKEEKVLSGWMLYQYDSHRINKNKCKCIKIWWNHVNGITNNEKSKLQVSSRNKNDYQFKITQDQEELRKLKKVLGKLEKQEEIYLNKINSTTMNLINEKEKSMYLFNGRMSDRKRINHNRKKKKPNKAWYLDNSKLMKRKIIMFGEENVPICYQDNKEFANNKSVFK